MPFYFRIFDLIFSFLGLFVLIPVLGITYLTIFLFECRSPLFRQIRIGKHKKPFTMLKFRTMPAGTKSVPTHELENMKFSIIGRWLRASKLDELPQLINVMYGDMSLVGPRPLVTKTFTAYNEEVQSKIYNVKPGLTGIGSIIFRDEESIISAVTDEDPHEFYKRIIAPYKGELEMWYQEHNSFFLDLQLIFMTAWVILSPTSKLYEKWFKDLPKRNF